MKASYFDFIYNDIKKDIDFSEEWCNGTGYFDRAVYDVKLTIGGRARSIDPHGRKIIFIGTRFGTVVLFERYTRPNSEPEADVVMVVTNTPRELRKMITGDALPYPEFVRIVGSGEAGNIGTYVESMF